MKRNRRKNVAPFLSATLLMLGTMTMPSCDDSVLTGEPAWLGSSIYNYLQSEGNYSVTLKLIDELNYTSVLSQTGSKTLFVADDDAYQAFFKNNDWGVTSYDQLTLAQKNMLLNSSMINNAYLVELLSNVSGTEVQEGKCMRRETAASVYDSVPRIYPKDMPNTVFWEKYKDLTGGMLLMKDNSTKPMIHFLPVFMRMNDITDKDLRIITNGESSSIKDAWVNGKKIVERDIVCKNGYVHKVDGVMTSADNMAEIINKHKKMTTFSRLLNRFCAPYFDETGTLDYNRLHGTDEKVYTLKYFANKTSDEEFVDPDGKIVDATLAFDPGWNQYIFTNTAGKDLHYDAGAMLVPSDDAMEAYWNSEGKVLQDMYKEWDNVPLKVLSKLININMVSTFIETVPSKFKNIVDNTTKVSLGVEPENVDSCYMGCNGVVYLLDKVFPPADYSSVSFPALVNEETMNIIYWGISELEFEPYLNSMDSHYSFFIPTNTAMVSYIDPCSYGKATQVLYQFYYDKDSKKVKAHRVGYDMATGTVLTDAVMEDASDEQVKNRMTDLLDNLIVVDTVETGHTYYKTKGGSMLKVAHAGAAKVMTVSGGLQVSQGKGVVVDSIYDQSNGNSYILTDNVPMASAKSVYATLKEHTQYSEFFKLLAGSKLLSQKLSGKYTCPDYNISFFDAFNYTVYVPSNNSILDLQEQGYLPTWEDYEALTADDFGGDAQKLKKAKTILEDRINDFLRYHFQDISLMIGAKPTTASMYETFKMNPITQRFFNVTVTADDNAMSVKDYLGNTRQVVKTEGVYNNLCRDIWIKSTTKEDNIYNASDAVVHSIDGVLLYDNDQLTSWQEEINNL